MIKALRITSIIAVFLGAVFFVFPVVFGVRRNEQVEEFLKSPGVIEQFGKAEGQKKTKGSKDDSPLVKQAEAFALYLSPPQPKTPSTPSPTFKSVRRPKSVSPKFELIGTSFYALHPELSLALIDMPGKGIRWVRQSSEVGHLIIEQIKDGVVVVRDGQKTFELIAERPERINLVKEALPIGLDTMGAQEPAIAEEPPSKKTPRRHKEVMVDPEEMLTKLEAIQAGFKPDGNDSSDEKSEMLERFISNYRDKAMRITEQEAKKLEELGEVLNGIHQDPNRTEDDVNTIDANLTDVNNPG